MTLLVVLIGNYTLKKSYSDHAVVKKKRLILIMALIGWHIYVYVVAKSGILLNFELPPKMPLFLIMPLFVFTGVFIYKNRNSLWIKNIPSSWLVYIQSFRVLVETLFVFSVAEGTLNYHVTIEGYNYDMVLSFSALIIGYLVYQKKIVSEKIMIAWNYIGLLVLASVIFVFMTCTYIPELYGSETMLLPKEAVVFPQVLIAGFLMPLAVFIHVLSLVHLKKKGV